MKHIFFKKISIITAAVFGLLISVASCKKSNPSSDNNPDPGPHSIDQRLVGNWMWTSAGDAGWYSSSGVYNGPSYGLALQYQIHADGKGSAYNHLYSSLGAGSTLQVNISSTGYFESDDSGHVGYFPLNGHYKSTSGEDRALNSSELWNDAAGNGKCYVYQKLEFKTINGRQCFEVTSFDGITDRYYKMN